MLVEVRIVGRSAPLIKLVKLSDPLIPALLMTRYTGLALQNQLHLLNHGVDLLFSFIDGTRGRLKVKLTLVDNLQPMISLAA